MQCRHDCWRLLTCEERTRPHSKYLTLHRTSVPFASLGKTIQNTDSRLNALHMMGRLVNSLHLLPDASKYGQCYLPWTLALMLSPCDTTGSIRPPSASATPSRSHAAITLRIPSSPSVDSSPSFSLCRLPLPPSQDLDTFHLPLLAG